VFGASVLVLALAAAGLVSGRFAVIPANRVGEASDATLIRTGGSQPLETGGVLNAGDEIRVAADGHATLVLGSSQARLAGGADLRVNILSSSNVQLALLTGRAYNRVVLPAGGTYTVVTGPYSWTAAGTAFDVQRTPAPSGGELVVALALEHALTIDGPETQQQVPEGSSASVLFGNPTSTGVTVGPIPTTDFSDPWLINNAKTDESEAYPIGALAGVALAPNGTPVASPSPSASPSDSPTNSPSLEPSPSDSPSPSPSPTPGLTPNPAPSDSPSPSPSPSAPPRSAFSMATTSCPGGVVLSWSKYTGPGFARYVTLRSALPDISTAYPQANALVVTSSSVQKHTSGADGTVETDKTYFYRTLVLDSAHHVLAASAEMNALGYGPADLGSPSVVGTTHPSLSWAFYPNASCFTEYRVQYSTDSTFSSGVSSILVTPLTQSNTPLPASTQWIQNQVVWFRVQVVRIAGSDTFVVGQTGLTSKQY
jgi:hypothetical protein